MAELKNELGKIVLNPDIIKSIVSLVVLECNGLVRMVSKRGKDAISGLWRRDNGARGVEIKFSEDNGLLIKLFIEVEYGVNIPEVVRNIKDRVCRVIAEMTGFQVKDIKVYVEGIHVGGT